ncbi:MAG: hypothetical protein JO104_00870, partial [Candidatus Eremiobacteraeota bacterium]|nr:hypothetical protein [Candidatus Eremiobacteraeota bacterium]
MPRRKAFAGAALAIGAALGACTGDRSPDDRAVCAAYSAGRSHVEVVADGRVTRLLGVQEGRISPHEGFLLRLASGCSLTVRVEANTDFTGPIPLALGQTAVV